MTSPAVSTRRVQRLRHELRRRELVVSRVARPSPGFVEVTFAGESLDGFVSASFDDHVKLFLPGPGGEPVGRDLTPRRFDAQARELVIEFALHDAGVASDWARQAAPGQAAVVGGPRGSFVVPLDYDWHLLAGDASALPAIARRLEELPAHAPAIVRIHADPADRRPLASRAALDLAWTDSADALVDAIRALSLPAGDGYAWCAGEAASMAAIRRALIDEKGHPREAARIAAYWKRGAAAHHETLD